MLKLTWMAAGALFLTLWSRFRDDRLERKGKLTEVHDRLAFSVEGRERVGEGAGGYGGRQDGQGQQTPPDVSGRKRIRIPPSALIPAHLRRDRRTGVQYSICDPIPFIGLRD